MATRYSPVLTRTSRTDSTSSSVTVPWRSAARTSSSENNQLRPVPLVERVSGKENLNPIRRRESHEDENQESDTNHSTGPDPPVRCDRGKQSTRRQLRRIDREIRHRCHRGRGGPFKYAGRGGSSCRSGRAALQGDGPFTVFAPTDEAFAKLPAGTLESLLKPENKGQLTAILTYHVAPGRLMASDVVSRERIETLNGQQPAINADGHGVRIDQANVIKTDIVTANGVIHVIDEVILPREESSARV